MTPTRKATLKRALYPMPVRERISHRGLLEKYRSRPVTVRNEPLVDQSVKH